MTEQEKLGMVTDRWESVGLDVNDVMTEGSPAEREQVLDVLIQAAATAQRLGECPAETAQVMPTRLGNALRRYEMRAGAVYRLAIGQFASHLGMVARTEQNEYVSDQRNQLDLAVRMTAIIQE